MTVRVAGSPYRWLRRVAPLVLVVWLLFLPNSLYLMTDLVHLEHRKWYWIDLPCYAMLTWCGIQYALLSFVVVPTIRRWSGWTFPVAVCGILILVMMGLLAGRLAIRN